MNHVTRRCLAATQRGLNRVTLCGVLHSAHTGLHSGIPAVEFLLVAQVAEPASLSVDNKASASPLAVLQPQLEQYTIRCLGSTHFVDALSGVVEEKSVVELTGSVQARFFSETAAGSTTTSAAKEKVSHTHTLVVVRQDELRRTAHAMRFLSVPSATVPQRANAALRDAIFAMPADGGNQEDATAPSL